MKTHLLKAQCCPECGYPVDRTSGVIDQKPPKKGDAVLCVNCAAINVFDKGLKLRRSNVSDLVRMQKAKCWPLIEHMQWAIKNLPRPR